MKLYLFIIIFLYCCYPLKECLEIKYLYNTSQANKVTCRQEIQPNKGYGALILCMCTVYSLSVYFYPFFLSFIYGSCALQNTH